MCSQLMRTAPAEILAPGEVGQAPQLDMALIGMGNDGHVGSVYPGSEAAQFADATVRNTRVSIILTMVPTYLVDNN